jgi:alpha-beta hydrolase superfamily lysophospholipase
MTPAAPRAFYLTSGIESAYALFDAAPTTTATTAGVSRASVLLCPLFGNDDLCAYRARYEWARVLAAAGHPALRIDLPGTGDSGGGPYEPARADAWTDAIATAARWLREECDQTRVTAVGIGLGGLLAYRAATDGAPIDDLVLWSVPARGRTLVRNLRVLSQMEASTETAVDAETSTPAESALESAGFVMSAETVATLEALDLTKLELPGAASRRVLLLERDGLDVDARLRATLERSGAKVTVAPGPGYGAMVTPPQQSRPPVEVFATVDAWLKTRVEALGAPPPATSAATPSHPPASAASSLEMTVHGVHVRETPLMVANAEGELFGILAEADEAGPLCAVLLNAGAIRHIGPGRMWVELARRWAARGVPTLRLDLAGIGDANGDLESLREDAGFYVSRYVGETRTALDALAARGLPQRFVLAGLCSGAYWSLHAALEDERVAGAYMVNPRALFWASHLGGVRDARNIRKVAHPSTWQRLLRGKITAQRAQTIATGAAVALRSLPARTRASWRAARHGDELEQALERLQATGTELFGVFTAEEPLLEELERNGGLARMQRRPNVRIELIPGPLTSHTLEPLPLQQAVHRALDGALEQQLRRAGEQDAGVRGDEHSAPTS